MTHQNWGNGIRQDPVLFTYPRPAASKDRIDALHSGQVKTIVSNSLRFEQTVLDKGPVIGTVPRTSTCALINAALPYLVELADKGWEQATAIVPGLTKGLPTHDGKWLSTDVADAHSYTPATV
ncbi:hypothetical protein [Rhodococcus koreensis]